MHNDQCVTCFHKAVGYAICRAFPDGIPDDIAVGKIAHNKPIKGDHGYQYQPLEKYADR